jgi:hypothetical protein
MMGIASEILNLDGYLRKDPRTYQVAPPAVRLALPEGWLVARGSISEDTYRLLGRSDNSSSGTTSYFYEVTLHGDLYLSGEYSPVWGRRPSAYLSFRSTGVISTDVPPRTGFGPIIQRNPYSGHLGYFMLPNLSNPTTVYPSESESFIGTIDGIPTSPYLRSSNAINRIELDGDGNLSIHFNTLNSVIDGRYYDSDSPLDLSAIPILDSIPTYPSEFTTEWRR